MLCTGYLRCVLFAMLTAVFLQACCTPPPADFMQQERVQEKTYRLEQSFLALLPGENAQKPGAVQEARWLAHTAMEQSAAIARHNDVDYTGWINNIFVNAGWKKRGLCWQVQQDLYRDLRKRSLRFFRVALTVRDLGKRREHSCVYVNAAGKGLADALVLDAWEECGHLVVLAPQDRDPERWQEDWREPYVSAAFPEGHSYGIDEHLVWPDWAKKKSWLKQQQIKQKGETPTKTMLTIEGEPREQGI